MVVVAETVGEALRGIASGASIAVGGFGRSGTPERLVAGLCDLGLTELEVISNNIGLDPGTPMHRLLVERRVARFVGSFPGGEVFLDQFYAGDIELELVPQGTLAERLRAGGHGIPAFYTPAGVGTLLGDGGFVFKYDRAGKPALLASAKERRSFHGREYLLEEALRPQVGLVKAKRADRAGNLAFHLSAMNFNPLVALAAECTIVEAEEIVDVGEISPEEIRVPGIAVDILTVGRDAS